MSTRKNRGHDHPSTYFVEDRANQEELARLQILDRMATKGMRGVLPEQPDPGSFQRVIDVGCGTGGWLIDTAKTYPTISQLIGIDVSSTIITYARSQAKKQGVSDRVEFHVMDALHRLEFPTDYFDLVNHRMAWSWLRTWDWPKLLQEYRRVCRPGGVIRLTEADLPEGNSPAMMHLHRLLLRATYEAGRLFSAESNGVNSQLADLLHRYGVQSIQTRSYTVQYRVGTAEWQDFYEDMSRVYRTAMPFLRKWTKANEDYETTYQQAISEMQQLDFVATWNLVTAWGRESTLKSP